MKVRVLLITDAVGGVWVYSVELARALKPLGIDCVLAVLGPSPSEQRRSDAAGIDLIDTGLPLDWFDTSPREIRRAGAAIAAIASARSVDLVQTSSAALLADVHFEQPCIAVQHSCVASWWSAVRRTPLPTDFAWRRDLVECGLNGAAAVVAPSISFAAETSRLYGVHALSVHNGRTRPQSVPIPPGDFVFTAGRLWDEGKNVATLDGAARRLNIPFQAAGALRGPNGTAIHLEHMRSLGELSAQRLMGLFAARPIYASAALYEPFGLSVLEAASSGCALVLSDIPTHREIWGGAAIFAPARDDLAFASAIQDLMEDRDEREQLGRLARARARHYSAERMALGMADIYHRLAGSAEPAPLSLAGAA